MSNLQNDIQVIHKQYQPKYKPPMYVMPHSTIGIANKVNQYSTGLLNVNADKTHCYTVDKIIHVLQIQKDIDSYNQQVRYT